MQWQRVERQASDCLARTRRRRNEWRRPWRGGAVRESEEAEWEGLVHSFGRPLALCLAAHTHTTRRTHKRPLLDRTQRQSHARLHSKEPNEYGLSSLALVPPCPSPSLFLALGRRMVKKNAWRVGRVACGVSLSACPLTTRWAPLVVLWADWVGETTRARASTGITESSLKLGGDQYETGLRVLPLPGTPRPLCLPTKENWEDWDEKHGGVKKNT